MASVTRRMLKGGAFVYEMRVFRGRDPETGRQLRQYSRRFRPPEGCDEAEALRLAREAAELFEAECRAEQTAKAAEPLAPSSQPAYTHAEDGVTFGEYTIRLLGEMQATHAGSTVTNYRAVLSRANAAFGDMPLRSITADDVRRYLADMRIRGTQGAGCDKAPSNGTLRMHYSILHRAFECAVDAGLIAVSPMRSMRRPRPSKDSVVIKAASLSEADVHRILNHLECEKPMWRAMIMFFIDSGCRRGEVVGLRWDDIDYESGRVNIMRNAQYSAARGCYCTTPKSGRMRSIVVNEPVLNALREWQLVQLNRLSALGVSASGYCFTNDGGQMLHPQTVTAHIKALGDRCGIDGLHPHMFRHTMATLSIAHGADVVSVSRKLGHSNPSITLNVYSHADLNAQRRASAALSAVLYPSGAD